MTRAYRELERDVLESARGRGTFVRSGRPLLGKAERRRRLRPLLEQVIAEARTPGFEDDDLVIELERVLGTAAGGCPAAT
jgi:DNA-binding transcriptional regulator YhcF (GntR family)